MLYLNDNPKPNYYFIFLITESVNNENEFFRRLVNKVIKSDIIKQSQKILTFIERHKPIIKKVGLEGVEFSVNDKLNYKDMLIRILRSFHSADKRLIIMLDEFSETLDNIIEDESETAGKRFLQSNRELRQDIEVSNSVKFIYTGSIGLENIVNKLNAMNTINDLKSLRILPLSEKEAKQLIKQLLEDVNFAISNSLINYILKRIEWLIPFYIQLIIEKLNNIYRDDNISKMSKDIIDKAFAIMLEDRQHFEHWHTRLRASLKGAEYNFIKELLNKNSENGSINSNEIFDLAVKYELEDAYRDLLNSLVYDGYINNNDDKKNYRFNSPILGTWWRENVAN